MPKVSVRFVWRGFFRAVALGLMALLAMMLVGYSLLTPTKGSMRNVDNPNAGPNNVEQRSQDPGSADGGGRNAVQSPLPRDTVALASPGRIEGESDSIEVGAAIDGVIQKLHAREGQTVKRGDLLAELDCRDLRSALPVSVSETESLKQVRQRLLRGSRTEERQAAAEQTAAARAVAAHASAQLERNRNLIASNLIPRVAFEEANRDAQVAEAQYQHALRNEELVNTGPLPEDIARADADIRAAEERTNLAEEKLGKCSVLAPIDGTILKIILREGESFALVSPRPLLTMANLSKRRVRAEVDERDVGKAHIGEQAVVSSEAYPGKMFNGKITHLALAMGRKSVLTGDPADKTDRDVLEVIAELESAADVLPVGLRVIVQFGP